MVRELEVRASGSFPDSRGSSRAAELEPGETGDLYMLLPSRPPSEILANQHSAEKNGLDAAIPGLPPLMTMSRLRENSAGNLTSEPRSKLFLAYLCVGCGDQSPLTHLNRSSG